MRPNDPHPPRADRELALAALAWLLFATPVATLWASPRLGWLAPFALWLALILAAAGLAWLRRNGR